MNIDNEPRDVRLVIAGLYDGPVRTRGEQLAFVAQGRRRTGLMQATIDGELVRVMVSFAPEQERARVPMMIATVLPTA